MKLPKTDPRLECQYPNLSPENYEIKGSSTREYNCASVADGNYGDWLHPPHTTKGLTCYLENRSWRRCNDGETREGYFKLAIYIGLSGEWSHIAVRQRNGKWLSKLGEDWLIEHNTVGALEGFCDSAYGVANIYMERKRRPHDP